MLSSRAADSTQPHANASCPCTLNKPLQGRPPDQSSFKEQRHPEKSKRYPKAKLAAQSPPRFCFSAALAGPYAPPPFSGVPFGHGFNLPRPGRRKKVCASLPRAKNVPAPKESQCRAWMLIFSEEAAQGQPHDNQSFITKNRALIFFFSTENPSTEKVS